MTKNNGRKKANRNFATRSGQRYTRARRQLASHDRTAPMQAAVADPAEVWIFEEQLHELQRLLEARGWVLSTDDEDMLDEQGCVISPEATWEYPAAYTAWQLDQNVDQGQDLDSDDEDAAPHVPLCRFSFEQNDDRGELIVVDTAGNWKGCEAHRVVHHEVPATKEGLAQLPTVLADIEEQARTLDPTALIECSTSGPCSGHIARRAAQRQTFMDWFEAMRQAYEQRLTDQQRAELHAWEEANLDGHSVATSDWPGWVPLIGAPPWRNPQWGE
ncbi:MULTISPECIES: hypothetical protein [unclassified Crossiella]|uniref:hypothetical protein n=1 Tax=unclassified Crossiella TaxID=2620835 RepID=UPI001FFEE497|nr:MULTISPECIES: hypothetical protein [unclassified Crossiella]MCK2240983.1 hypothetical protein [Crossiella sp. S99.2]MCK2253873.1 hypothetical protein [Crossiella sp. S99.1]